MISTSDHIDHQTLIDILVDKGIEKVSIVQESKVSFNEIRSSYGTEKSHTMSDWGNGFYFNHGSQEAFYSSNELKRSYSPLITIADSLIAREGKYQPEDKVFSKPIKIDISKNGPWNEDPKEEATNLVNYVTDILAEQDSYHFRIEAEGQLVNKSFQSSYTGTINQRYNSGYLTIEVFDKHDENSNYLVTSLGGIDKEDVSYRAIENETRDIISKFKELQQGRQLPSDTYAAVLNQDTTYTLIHETIGHGTEADQIITADSFLHDKIGKKVASSDLTVIDDPHIRSSGWAEFDDEGTKTTGTMLVENGFLVDYLHTTKTAKLMGTIPTGNARATSYLSPPEPRQTNLYIEPKDHSSEELLEEVKDGIYLGPTLSASTSLYSGKYMIEIQYGFHIRDGELTEIYRPFTISGNSLETLNNIDLIGRDVKQESSYCMKDNSKLMIGTVAPEVVVSEVFVS